LRDREFSDQFNASAQRRLAADHPRAATLVLGQLRLDLVSYRTVVIPDTHLLDGTVLLTLAPNWLSAATQRHPARVAPIEFPCRAESLADSLAGLLGCGDFLNAFRFNCIRNETAREAVATALSRTQLGVVTGRLANRGPVEAITSVVLDAARSQGVETEVVEDLELLRQGWEQWLEADVNFSFRRYRRPFDLGAGLLAAPRPRGLVSDEGRAALPRLLQVLRNPNGRKSEVDSLLGELSTTVGPSGEGDVHRLTIWAERVRHIAIAKQHAASYSHDLSEHDPDLEDFEDLFRRGRDAGTLDEFNWATERLGNLSNQAWVEFNHRAAQDLESWWVSGENTARSRALAVLADVLERAGTDEGVMGRDGPLVEVVSPLGLAATGSVVGTVLSEISGSVTTGSVLAAGAVGLASSFGAKGRHAIRRTQIRRRLHRILPS
jgi:hypothetical protein